MNVIRSTNSSMDSDLPTRSTRSSCRMSTFVKEGSDVFSLFIQFPGTENEKEGPSLLGHTSRSATSWRSRTRSESRVWAKWAKPSRSEEHTSELQSRLHLVCRLLLEKKKK